MVRGDFCNSVPLTRELILQSLDCWGPRWPRRSKPPSDEVKSLCCVFLLKNMWWMGAVFGNLEEGIAKNCWSSDWQLAASCQPARFHCRRKPFLKRRSGEERRNSSKLRLSCQHELYSENPSHCAWDRWRKIQHSQKYDGWPSRINDQKI